MTCRVVPATHESQFATWVGRHCDLWSMESFVRLLLSHSLHDASESLTATQRVAASLLRLMNQSSLRLDRMSRNLYYRSSSHGRLYYNPLLVVPPWFSQASRILFLPRRSVEKCRKCTFVSSLPHAASTRVRMRARAHRECTHRAPVWVRFDFVIQIFRRFFFRYPTCRAGRLDGSLCDPPTTVWSVDLSWRCLGFSNWNGSFLPVWTPFAYDG